MGTNLRELTDRELVRMHVDGDTEAFGELFRRHRDRMWAVALRTTGNPELAADCVQDAFIAAYRRAGSFRGDAAFTTWLHRIVVNACIDRLRRDRPTSDLADYDLADPHDAHDTAMNALDVRAALAQIPEPQRLALVLVDMQGLPVNEAAAVLGVPEGTVKSRCFRGRAAMLALLGESRTEASGAPAKATTPPASTVNGPATVVAGQASGTDPPPDTS